MEAINILGVKISKVDYRSAINQVERLLIGGGQHFVATPNPEFVVLAQKDPQFRKILNQADLAIPDGVGLRLAAKFLSLPTKNWTIVKFFLSALIKPSYLDVLPYQVTGTDLMVKLCGLAAAKNYTVFLLGAQPGVAAEAAKRLAGQFANLKIIGTHSGDPGEEFDNKTRSIIVRKTQKTHRHSDTTSRSEFADSIDLLFVAYGAPAQEKWIVRNLSHLPVKVAIGVGGAFDFMAGRKKRAPRVLRRLGLEWVWRFIQEPQRYPRIFAATIKFPLLVFRDKLNQSRPRHHSLRSGAGLIISRFAGAYQELIKKIKPR